MHRNIACVVALLVSVGATLGTAQVTLLPTPPPQVTANAEWQVSGEPIFYTGDFYYRTGPDVFFDGNVMKRTGVNRGVPLYEDSTLEPYSIVYVPVGRNLMRPYERRRAGQLAGTVGSRTPSFPIERDVEVSVAAGLARDFASPPAGISRRVVFDSPRAVATTGPLACCQVGPIAPCGCVPVCCGGAVRSERQNDVANQAEPRSERQPSPGRPSVESIPAPPSNAGMWVEFNGSRWYLDGPAVLYDRDQFIAAGLYHGFPVYQKRGGPDGEIYLQSVEGGLVAPFRRR